MGLITGLSLAKLLPVSLAKTLRHHGLDDVLATTVLGLADSCLATRSQRATPFLSPLEAEAVRKTFGELAELSVTFLGGYPQAERRVAVFRRLEEFDEYLPAEDSEVVRGDESVPSR